MTTKKKYRFAKKSYWEPTPKKARKIGDSLLGVFSIISMSSIIMDYKPMAMVALIIGIIGKILTNYFSEDPIIEQTEEFSVEKNNKNQEGD